jgi:RNA polymerase sigma-70 factor (ECF subfamily)
MHALPSPDLVVLARDGDERAREQLMTATLPTVLAWCRRLGGPKVDAEDAAHDVLIVVLTKLHGLRQEDRYGSWVFGITRRILAKHRRRSWVKNWIGSELPDVADSRPDPSRHTELSELAQQVEGILAQLPAAQREVLVLCDVEERTDEAVAALLGVPVGTATSRLRLARAKFRRLARGRALAPQFVGLTTWGQG